MGMRAPVTGQGDFAAREVPPEGNYLAVCNGVYVLGTQPGYNGGDARLQVMLTFELHKRKGPSRDSQDRVFETNAIMNLTANIKSTLVEYAGALRGKAYTETELEEVSKAGGLDPEELIGKCCRLEVEHKPKGTKGEVKDKIKSVSRLDPDDDAPPVGETDEVYWDWTLGIECPKRIGFFWDRAAENPERKPDSVGAGKARAKANPGDVDPDDDTIPF